MKSNNDASGSGLNTFSGLADHVSQILLALLIFVVIILAFILMGRMNEYNASIAEIENLEKEESASVSESIEDKQGSSQEGSDGDNNGGKDVKIQAILQLVETERIFGDISTSIWSIVSKDTGESLDSLDSGNIQLSMDDVRYAYMDFLQKHKYYVISIGLVNNQFYIQQDISKPIKGNILVGLVSMDDEFTIEDWFKLTESVYNNTDTQADCIFNYQTESGNRHYLYVYMEKDGRVNNSNTGQSLIRT